MSDILKQILDVAAPPLQVLRDLLDRVWSNLGSKVPLPTVGDGTRRALRLPPTHPGILSPR